MAQSDVELKVLRQHWIRDDGVYDPQDLCSHGEAFIQIGDEVLSTESNGSWTLSVAALFLMRTLDRDIDFMGNDNHLVPCCGHEIYPLPEAKNGLLIQGCGSGIDWKVSHQGQVVELQTVGGARARIALRAYQDAIIGFAKDVARFYGNLEDKDVSGNHIDVEGFNLFWAEWRSTMRNWS